ncbi:hypothetical protein D3C73_1483260 [compost metagenome]
MTEAPELEVVLEIDEILAGLVQVPVLLRIHVDLADRRHDSGGLAVRLAHVSVEDLGGHRQTAP